MTFSWHDIDGRMVELCDECGFDARDLTGSESEARRLDAGYAELERALQNAAADRRPAAETWSAVEYAGHCVEIADVMLRWVADLVGETGDLAIRDLADCRRAVATLVPPLSEPQRGAVLHGEYRQPVTVAWLLGHLLHDLEHHVLDVRRGHASLARTDHPEVDFSQ